MTPQEQSYKNIRSFLDLQTNRVKRNCEIVAAEDQKYPFMLHIDVAGETPKSFFPQMPRRASLTEDNTLARVTVADTLFGCIIAYADVQFNFHNGGGHHVDGYEINAIDYTHCLKVNSRLVYDAETTNEHWLIGYDKQNVTYKPRKIGTFFPIQATYVRKKDVHGKNYPHMTKQVICLQVKEEFLLTKFRVLKPGDYLLTLGSDENWSIDRNMCFDDTDNFQVKSISKTQLEDYRKMHASGLSLEQRALLSKW